MKKLFTIGVLAALTMAPVMAQKGKVATAQINLQSGELAKAKENIDVAFGNEEVQALPKAWITKGDIYKGIYEQREAHKDIWAANPNALTTAKEAYLKAFEIEANPKKKKDVKDGLNAVGGHFYNEGIANFSKSDWEGAYNNFKNTLEISEFLYKNEMATTVDTQAYFVVALSGYNSQHLDEAQSAGEKLFSLGDKREVIYTILIDIYKQKGLKDKYEKTLSEGRAQYPQSLDLLYKEINFYLENDKLDVLEEKLNQAIQLDPSNHTLYQALANVHDRKGDKEGALAMYDKAIAANPEYYEAYYNKAIVYFNDAMAIIEKMNDEFDNKKYEALKAQREVLLKEKALPLLQKAHQLKPDDENVTKALKEVYARLEMFDEIKKLNK